MMSSSQVAFGLMQTAMLLTGLERSIQNTRGSKTELKVMAKGRRVKSLFCDGKLQIASHGWQMAKFDEFVSHQIPDNHPVLSLPAE